MGPFLGFLSPAARSFLALVAQLRFRTAVEFVQLLCALPNLKSLVCRGTFCVSFAAARQSLDGYSNVVKQKALYLTYLVVRQTSIYWCTMHWFSSTIYCWPVGT